MPIPTSEIQWHKITVIIEGPEIVAVAWRDGIDRRLHRFMLTHRYTARAFLCTENPFEFPGLGASSRKDRMCMTTIFFKRSGGFVGQGIRFQVDLNQLPIEDARRLNHLIAQADFFSLPENFIIKFNPDEYQYTITVDTEDMSHTVRANDSTMPASLRPLVDQLSSLRSVAG
jgi:hypothetical protein